MTPLRVLDTGMADAEWNVSMSAALLELHAEGRIPDTLRLHRYRRCLLAGVSHQEDHADDARPGVIRRMSGGGTVAMTPGILAWDLVAGRRPRPECVGRALARAFGRFGARVTFCPPGDIVAGTRKLAGIAGAYEGSSRLHQGCVLVDCDPAELAGRFCLPPRPVVTLAELAGKAPAMSEVGEAVAVACSDALGLPLRRGAPGRLELERAGTLALAEAEP